jgi:hypothetical protein
MEPVTAATLAAARQRWESRGADAYRLLVRVRAPRFAVAVYEVVVVGGQVMEVVHDGREVRPEDAGHDYSVAGLFALLQEDLSLVDQVGDTPALDLRARFEPETGRLVRYRRTVGSTRRRVLLVEVLEYQPLAIALRQAAGSGG